MSRRRTHRQPTVAFDTYLALLIYIGLAIATLKIDREARQVVLWCALLGLSLAYSHRVPFTLSRPFVALGRGVAVGLVISLPVLFLAQSSLAAISGRLLPPMTGPAAFQSLVLLAPLAEGLFFRGLLQKQHGLVAQAITYGLFHVFFFLPTLGESALIIVPLAAVGVVLGFLYGYVSDHYGLAASVACHITMNAMLLFLPPLIQEGLRRWA